MTMTTITFIDNITPKKFMEQRLEETNGAVRTEAQDKPSVRIQKVTPAMAEKWLGFNSKNRVLRSQRVRDYMGALERTEWNLTTDCVGFDIYGNLTNGQHRLVAIAMSGVPAVLGVMRGLPPESQAVTDQVLVRTLKDTLGMMGHHYVTQLQGALNWLYRLDYIERTGKVHYSHKASDDEDGLNGLRPSTSQLLERFEQNPGLAELSAEVYAMSRDVPVRPGLYQALHYRFLFVDREDAEGFATQVRYGENLKRSDPAYTLRAALINDARSGKLKMQDYKEAAIVVKAWNAFREGRPMEQVSYKFGGVHRERFPAII